MACFKELRVPIGFECLRIERLRLAVLVLVLDSDGSPDLEKVDLELPLLSVF